MGGHWIIVREDPRGTEVVYRGKHDSHPQNKNGEKHSPLVPQGNNLAEYKRHGYKNCRECHVKIEGPKIQTKKLPVGENLEQVFTGVLDIIVMGNLGWVGKL